MRPSRPLGERIGITFDLLERYSHTHDESLEQNQVHLVAVENPIRQMTQSDGRIRRWARIREADDRVLRVVLLADGETVHNAFFDRSFREAE